MESNKEEKITSVSEENIYKLNGRVPLRKAIPFGLQHVLAMFVSNLAPVLIVCSAAVLRSDGAHLSSAEITQLLQCAMFVAGIGTCLQLYPIGVIGSGLPIIMGVSFTFLGSLLVIATNPDLGYEAMAGAVILGGIFEGLVGLSARYWKRFLTPVVSACVVIAIGLSLLSVGMDSWGGGSGVADFGAWYHLVVGAFTLIVCLVARYLLKGAEDQQPEEEQVQEEPDTSAENDEVSADDAVQEEAAQEETEESEWVTETYINPLYADVIDESDLNGFDEDGIALYSADGECKDIHEAAEYMRSNMVNRVGEVTSIAYRWPLSSGSKRSNCQLGIAL